VSDQNFDEQAVQGAQTPEPESRAKPSRTADEIFSVDDRLLVLERSAREYRVHLFNLEDVLINQMVALGILEIVFAVFIAVTVWNQYKKGV